MEYKKHNSTSTTDVLREGWLEKWTNFLNSWKYRYVIMKSENRLCYGYSKGGPFKEISLNSTNIQLHHGDALRIDISTKEKGLLFFKADSIESRNLWYFALKKSRNETAILPPEELPASPAVTTIASDIANADGIDRSKGIVGGTTEQLRELARVSRRSSDVTDVSQQHRNPEDKLIDLKSLSLSPTSAPAGVVRFPSDQSVTSDKPAIPIIENMENDYEKSALKCLSDNLVACKQHTTLAFKRIRKMQSTLIENVGRLYSQRAVADPFLKNSIVQLLQQIDLVESIVQCHLDSCQTFCADERAQREQIEKSLQWFAKKCRAYEMVLMKPSTAEPKGSVLAGSSNAEMDSPFKALDDEQSSDTFQEFFDCDELDTSVISGILADENVYTNEAQDGKNMKNEEDEAATKDAEDGAVLKDEEVEGQRENGTIQHLIQTDGFRVKLPVNRHKMNMSVWSVLKDFVGKELTRISMPVGWNEPTCFLQRIAEDFQYDNLLRNALNMQSSTERLAWVSVFVASPYASACGRTYKPFNPILGETYDMSHRGFKYLAEQVEHHPPITAYHVECGEFVSWGHILIKTSLMKGSLKVTMPGPVHLVFPTSNNQDHYVYRRTDLLVHNIILGNLWVELDGRIVIRNVATGDFSVLEFLPKGWIKGKRHKLRGAVFNAQNEAKFYISGTWSAELYITKLDGNKEYLYTNNCEKEGGKDTEKRDSLLCSDGSIANDDIINVIKRINWEGLANNGNEAKLVWKVSPRPADSEDYYGFSYFTMELNQLMDGSIFPPTDTRYRPDQRAYEEGNLELAKTEKSRLEEKQREAARRRKRENESYTPQWFERSLDSITNEETWTYKGGYWESKEAGKFEVNRSIF